MAIVAHHIRVSGKVQGVLFRASTKAAADERAIKGFVRNERDGSVYIEAEGEETSMEDFIAWCRQGPRMARVDNLDITKGEPKGFTGFLVTR
jgi:acylphosphatase